VSTSTNADAEAPRQGPTGLIDLRITDRDVILVRSALAGKFSNPHDGHYAVQLSFTVPATGLPVTFTRGWASVDYRHDAGTTVRILDTHLEVPGPGTADIPASTGTGRGVPRRRGRQPVPRDRPG
jgi:hypothetical protein